MRKILSTAAFAAAFGMVAVGGHADDDAQVPTWYRDIMPVFQENCMDCHRPEGMNLGGIIAPMSLMTYEETRPWAKSVMNTVQNREMPPWHAGEAFIGTFYNERTLTEEQIATVVNWVQAGTPAGNPDDAPPPIKWPETTWSMGEPDLVLEFDKPFVVEDHVDDQNTVIVKKIPLDLLPEDKYITAIEFKPGSSVVHHILGFVRPPRESGESLQMIGGIAPGSTPIQTVSGYGVKLHAGSTFIFQMHYNKEAGPGTAVEDVSAVAFKFADKPVHRLYVEAIGDPGRLWIPAGEKVMITSRRKWDRDVLIAGYLPHMHLRGTYAKYEALLPDGTREVLLETPAWSFEWQMSYEYAQPRRFPAGTIIEATMGYDNTAENEYNPDPTKNLMFGEETNDEMNLAWITWGYAEPTDHDPIPRTIGGGNDDLPVLAGGPPEELRKKRRGPDIF